MQRSGTPASLTLVYLFLGPPLCVAPRFACCAPLQVCTIHQPRSSIYRMFDRLLLLSEGRTMYFGEAAAAVAYFAAAGFHCPPQFNPADFFMDVT